MKLLIYFFIYLFIDNTFLNKDDVYNNKVYNVKSYVCNDMYLNISPISYNNLNIAYNPIKYNNTIEDCQCIYINKIKKEIRIYRVFLYIYSKIIIFSVNSIIVFIFIKIQDIKNKDLIINQITIRINYDINYNECSICYSSYKFNNKICKIIKCHHIYHENCINEWIIKYNNKTCPLCRSNIFE